MTSNVPRLSLFDFKRIRGCCINFALYKCFYSILFYVFYLFGVLRRFQHCTCHIMTGIWKGRGNQYIQFIRVLYCKLLTNGKQLPAFPLEAVPRTEPQRQRWEARVLPLCHRDPIHHRVCAGTNHYMYSISV